MTCAQVVNRLICSMRAFFHLCAASFMDTLLSIRRAAGKTVSYAQPTAVGTLAASAQNSMRCELLVVKTRPEGIFRNSWQFTRESESGFSLLGVTTNWIFAQSTGSLGDE